MPRFVVRVLRNFSDCLNSACELVQTAGPRGSTMAGFATRVSFAGRPSPSGMAACRVQKRKRNPAVGAKLLRWRKPKANPPFTCENMNPR